MIDTDKYEGHTEGPWTLYTTASHGPTIAGKLNDADWQLIADAPLLLAEVKRMQYWDEEMDRVIAHLAQHNWASSDGDVHEIVEYMLTEVKRLRSLAENLYDFYVGTYDGSLHLFEQQMDWREEE